jgi:hypothetical protein
MTEATTNHELPPGVELVGHHELTFLAPGSLLATITDGSDILEELSVAIAETEDQKELEALQHVGDTIVALLTAAREAVFWRNYAGVIVDPTTAALLSEGLPVLRISEKQGGVIVG